MKSRVLVLASLGTVLCAFAQIGAYANTLGYVAYVDATTSEPRLQQWSFDSTTLTYSLVGSPIGAAPAGQRVLTMEVNSNTGDVYTQTSDNVLRRWSHNGSNFSSLGSLGNDGGRGLAFAPDDGLYVLNGNSPYGGGPQWLMKVDQGLSGVQYFTSVNGNAVIADGNDVYVAANDLGGRIIHYDDTASSFSTVDFVPFNGASEMTLNPVLGGKYAAAHGYNKETGDSNGGTHWVITGSFAGFSSGSWDASNNGTGFDLVNDIGAGPDGTLFLAQRGAQNWISAWHDNGPASTPSLASFVGNNDNRGAWLAVDPEPIGGETIIHTATNDGSNQVLRAWRWNGTVLNLVSTAGFFAIPGASEMTEIAIFVPASVPEPTTATICGVSLLGLLAVGRTRREQ
jgi:hypothetical protein